MAYELLKTRCAGPQPEPGNGNARQWTLVVQGRTAATISRTKHGWTATSPQGRRIASLCETKEECVRQVLRQS